MIHQFLFIRPIPALDNCYGWGRVRGMELFVILGVIFFIFVASAGKDAIQIFLAGSWALVIISGVIGVLVAVVKAAFG